MLAYRYPLIAREGWHWIALAAAIALLLQWQLGWFAVPLWLPVGLLLFLFRDPPRRVPASPLGVVSPVDGRVLSVDTTQDSYLERQAIRITIQMRMTDILSVRSPMEGKVLQQWAGKHDVPASDPRYAQWIQSDEEDDVLLVIVPNLRVVRPKCYVHSGERIGQGQRCGFIYFGGRVEVWVPTGSRIDVNVGNTLQAGSDIIATLVHEKVVPPKVPPKVDSSTASGDH